MRRIHSLSLVLAAAVTLVGGGAATAKTSHEGWPRINGILFVNKSDRHAVKHGTRRSDELLGGHGNDTLRGRAASDVLWGDHKPSGQNSWQHDHLYGGGGRDFIYASHGKNIIHAGPGNDYVKAHFGRGSIDCGSGNDTLYISRRARKGYRIRHCERVSHRTLGY